MKTSFTTFVLIFVASVMANEKYTLDIDVDEVLKSDRLLNAFLKCFLDEAGCTPEAREIKEILPDVFKTGCSRCTDAQKRKSKKAASFVIKEKPVMWEKLVTKYDPDRIYSEKFRKQLKAEGYDI